MFLILKHLRHAIMPLLVVLSTAASAEVLTRTVEYRQGDTLLEGYLAYDTDGLARKPGVLIVHEWTGLGPYVKQRAEQLARLGYVAFAADIYGKGVRPDNPKDAGATASIYKNNRPLLRQRVAAGLEALRRQPGLDPARVAAIGYCFGGTTVLELARSGADLKGRRELPRQPRHADTAGCQEHSQQGAGTAWRRRSLRAARTAQGFRG